MMTVASPSPPAKRRWLWVSLAALLVAAAFVSGVFVGNFYRIVDFLCPATATPQRLTVDLVSNEGITFPAGAVVALRDCAYMRRFQMDFAVGKEVEFESIPEGAVQDTDFRILQPVE